MWDRSSAGSQAICHIYEPVVGRLRFWDVLGGVASAPVATCACAECKARGSLVGSFHPDFGVSDSQGW